MESSLLDLNFKEFVEFLVGDLISRNYREEENRFNIYWGIINQTIEYYFELEIKVDSYFEKNI